MKEVVMEVQMGGKRWQRLGGLCEAEPPGSISNDEPNGRQVYMFGWYNGDGPAVWRSIGGADLANDVIREVTSMGLEKIADLTAGPHKMKFWRQGRPMPLRFRVGNTS